MLFSLLALAASTNLASAHGGMAAKHAQPPLTLQFSTTLRVAQGYGHDGDGCVLAEAKLLSAPVVQRVWFDQPGRRLAQTNPGLRPSPHPDSNLTVVGLFARSPPTELDLDVTASGEAVCATEPLPDAYCANGSRTCPPVFGDFGFGKINALTSVLGSNFYNTTLLSRDPVDGSEVWQWEWVLAQRIPLKNGTVVVMNITRNYTYSLAATAKTRPDGTRPLLRFQWTQSIPLQPAMPVHRDCFVFDYTQDYVPGPIDPARWAPPPGVTCENRSRAGLPLSASTWARGDVGGRPSYTPTYTPTSTPPLSNVY